MTSRTAHALLHPCQDPQQCTRPEYGLTEPLPGGNLLHTILAVDR